MADTVDIHALAGAYALDAIDDVERAAFDRHLRDCPSCAIEVAELRETTTWLSHPVAVTPPPGLRDAVLAAVARTPQERGRRSTSSAPVALNRWRRWTITAVAASILAVGVGVGTWVVSDQRLRAERADNARVESVLAAPDARLVRAEMAGGRVSLVVSPSRDAAVAVLAGLESPGSQKAYELWMVGGSAVSVGLLPAGKGDGRRYIAGLRGSSTFAVSRERAKGVDQPTPDAIVGRIAW